MTADEFNDQFWPNFSLRFDEVALWISKMPVTHTSPSVPTQQRAMKLWRQTLADVDVIDANLAADAIFKGDEERPRSWSEYPAAIRRIARREASKRVSTAWRPNRRAGEEPRYRCLLCKDDGRALVWHETSMKAARDTPDAFANGGVPAYRCVIACSCRAGEAPCFEKWQRFDPNRHVAIPEIDVMRFAEARADLVRIVAEREALVPRRQQSMPLEAPANYEEGPYDFT